MEKFSERDINNKIIDEFRARVVVDLETGCWEWVGNKVTQGYGRFNIKPKVVVKAHRLSYVMYNGPIPNGLDLHHICNNPSCVNPSHLIPLSRGEHIKTMNRDPGKHNRIKTHCKQGHEFNIVNTYVTSKGRRSCRACDNKDYWYKKLGLK